MHMTSVAKGLLYTEMEAGQSSGLIKDIPSVKNLFEKLLNEIDLATGRNNQIITTG